MQPPEGLEISFSSHPEPACSPSASYLIRVRPFLPLVNFVKGLKKFWRDVIA
jgi:hypothetical protein